MNNQAANSKQSFSALHPDDVLALAEHALKRDFSNLFRPLNSYINRVFELEDGRGEGVIVKFYRPGRWSAAALADEHRFLVDLDEREIPVIAPLELADGKTLGCWQNIHYAFFPKCGGRSVDEFSDDQWPELGRLIGRMHAVGAVREASSRPRMHPASTTSRQIDFLLENDLVHADSKEAFITVAEELLGEITPRFEDVPMQRIHGDLHFSNMIYRPDESFYLIDFDDMVTGPQVQDVWMLLGAYGEDSLVELDLFLEGYELFHHFDRKSCLLIEPLRAMRYIHYLAWCGYQVVEDGGTQVLPDYGSSAFWQREVVELTDQIERIREAENPFGSQYG